MKAFVALLLSALTAVAAIPPISTYDSEAREWAKQKIPSQTNTVADVEYSIATEYMLLVKSKGLRRLIKRANLYMGSGLPSMNEPIIADLGGAISTNDVLNNFVAADYTTNGLTGNGSTTFINAGNFAWGVFTSINNCHLSCYNRSTSSEAKIVMGMSDGTLGATQAFISYSDVTYISFGGVGGAFAGRTDVQGVGHYEWTRTGTNFMGVYKNGVEYTNVVAGLTSETPPEVLYVHARDAGGTGDNFSTRQLCYYSAGLGMSPEQNLAHSRIVQRAQVRHGRGVNL